jgi:hypothetical protein
MARAQRTARPDLPFVLAPTVALRGALILAETTEHDDSSFSTSGGGACLEVAPCENAVHIRDSKLGETSPTFMVAGGAWAAFVAHARTGVTPAA